MFRGGRGSDILFFFRGEIKMLRGGGGSRRSRGGGGSDLIFFF
jgi:hypothetical protein